LSNNSRKTNSRRSKNRQVKQKLLQPILKKASEAIAILDDRGCFVEVNQSTCELFGRSYGSLVGSLLTELSANGFDFQAVISQAQEKSQSKGKLWLSTTERIWREVEYSLTFNVAPARHLVIFRDFDRHKEAIEEELQRQRQRVELFAEVTLKIRQSLQLKEILRTTVTEVQRILKADRVLIYQVFADGTGKAISEAVLPEYPAILGMEFPEEVFPEDYQQLYALGRVRAIANARDPKAEVAECLLEFIEQFGIKAKLIVPILLNLNSHQQQDSSSYQLWGLLIAHQCSSTRNWVEFELELMQQLADQIGIALAQAQLLENLEEIVAARTAQLQEVNLNLQNEINDRQEAEAALRRSEEQLRLITNALPVLIAYVDKHQRYRFNNQAYRDWLGRSPTELDGMLLKSVWGKACYQRMQAHVNKALLGQIVTYENEIVLKDNSIRYVSVTYIPHLDDRQQIKGFFALTSDISDRKAIERMKDEFISVVSHELRTPLTSLHSALKILATGRLGNLSEDGKQMLAIADENTDRLVRLVNNVLDLQRIESGEITMEKQICNAKDLTIQATEAMQAMAQQHEVVLIAQPLDLEIWVDPDYIMQTLTNLLSNAIKFSSAGGTVWLSVEISDTVSPKQILFKVRDRGQGIPRDKIESIFERFRQVDSSDSRKKGGTGLGLTICRKIVEQHDGKIWAESRLGEGSIFCFTLPMLAQGEINNNDETCLNY
jgi:two-component system, OmpR family, sensor histidine kinase VicK